MAAPPVVNALRRSALREGWAFTDQATLSDWSNSPSAWTSSCHTLMMLGRFDTAIEYAGTSQCLSAIGKIAPAPALIEEAETELLQALAAQPKRGRARERFSPKFPGLERERIADFVGAVVSSAISDGLPSG